MRINVKIKKMKRLNIKSCHWCPYKVVDEFGYSICKHPRGISPVGSFYIDDPTKIPEWCPLPDDK